MLKFYFASIISVRWTPLWEKGRIRSRILNRIRIRILYHLAKIVRNSSIPTVVCDFFIISSLWNLILKIKNVQLPSWKSLTKIAGAVSKPDLLVRAQRHGSVSVPKCHWSATLVRGPNYCRVLCVAGGSSGSLSIKKRRVDLGLCGGGGLPPPAHSNPSGLGRLSAYAQSTFPHFINISSIYLE